MVGQKRESAEGTVAESPVEQTTAPEKTRQVKAGNTARAAGQTAAGALAGAGGFSSPETPGTFDRATPPPAAAATFSSPVAPAAFGPVTPVKPAVSFSSPTTPAAFDPVGAIGSAAGSGSFGADGSFSAGSSSGSFGLDTKAARLSRLQEQRDRGQLTRQQFEAQRQQITDEV